MSLSKDTKFKLILGLGNKDIKSAIKIALLYAKAGARFFDTSPQIFPELKKNLIKNNYNLQDFTLCVSAASLGDIHGRKAIINQKLCCACGLCSKNCKENAIFKKENYKIDEKKCIGCGICKKITNCYAIFFEYENKEMQILKNLIVSGEIPDMIELHCSINNKEQIIQDFENILTFFKGDLSVCINKKQFPLYETVELLKKLKNILAHKNSQANFYVQADGASMNGGNADKNSTLECIEFAKQLEPYGFNLIISGGTNLNTPEMLDEFKIKPIIAYGTFARNFVAIKNEKEAFCNAKELYEKTLRVLC